MKRSVITLKKPSRKTVVDAAIPFLLLLLSFLFSSIWILLMGKNPLAAYMALLDGAFGSPAALMNTIKKSVPISFASFAIIVSMKGNSFNIGAEGQLALGAIGATLAGALIPGLPAPLHIAVCLSAGAVFGMLYILFPAVMHVRRGVDLLVILLLLNNVASYILQYFVLDFFKSDNALVPSSRKILETAELPYLIGPPYRMTIAIVFALVAAVVLQWYFSRTVAGYEMRAVGLLCRSSGEEVYQFSPAHQRRFGRDWRCFGGPWQLPLPVYGFFSGLWIRWNSGGPVVRLQSHPRCGRKHCVRCSAQWLFDYAGPSRDLQ